MKSTIIAASRIGSSSRRESTFRHGFSSAKRKMARGFTLLEIMVVIAIAGFLVSLLIPKLREAYSGSARGAGDALQVEIQNKYETWTSIGGRHSATGSPDLTLALITLLTSDPYSTTADTSPLLVTVNGDNNAISEQRARNPFPGTIRFTLPKGLPVTQTIAGVPTLVYGGTWSIAFTPTSTKSGTWTVTSIDN